MKQMSSRGRREGPGQGLARALACGMLAAVVPASVSAQVPANSFGLRANAARFTNSLKTVRPPDPTNFVEFVKDRQALIRLGKALFWDQQLGSDGQACASCHFHAGVDNRSRNQLNPGFRNQGANFPTGDKTFGNTELPGVPGRPELGPNYQLTLADFPLHRLADPEDPSSVLSDTNDVVSSQGVFHADFSATGISTDHGTPRTDGVFKVGDELVRNVEPRNTPSSVNAALNHRNFWDGRGRNEFNGVNPIGSLDDGAKVVRAGPVPQVTTISLLDSSAASQADGPPLSDLEMSFAGRSFAHLGRKMLSPDLEPLAQQLVAQDDSVLGPYSNQQFGPGVRGSTLRYADMVKAAIQPTWWDAPGWMVDVGTNPPSMKFTATPGPSLFTVMEYNFSLYFGLAIGEYEKTLISDDSPFDQWMEGREPAGFGLREMAGLQIFLSPGPGPGQGRCIKCHYGPAFTGAAFTNISLQRKPGNIERMVMGDFTVGAYDTGYYNIGVRPTGEDLGVGASIGPHDLPLSTTQANQDCVKKAVQSLRNNDPALALDDTCPTTAACAPSQKLPGAIRQANTLCKVPPIPARPNEAARVLTRAAELAAAIPVDVADVMNLLAQANILLAGEEPLSMNFIRGTELTTRALQLFEGCPSCFPPVDPRPGLTPEVTDLVARAKTLMPDAIAPPPGAEGALPVGPPLRPEERVVKYGAFKTPSIRNIELTAPFFHNGGQATLEQLVEFYDRGGDFHTENMADLDADIGDLGFTDQQKADMVAFMKALTDERVRYDRAPFDHPSLDIPNGGTSGKVSMFLATVGALDDRVELPAVGKGGSAVPLGTSGTPFANFPDPLWSALAAVSGDGQSAQAGATLPAPLVVKIADDRGNPVAGLPVSFTAPSGGSVDPASAVTGPDGTASTIGTLGPSQGSHAFTATAPVAQSSVTFVATTRATDSSSASSSGSSGCGTAPGTAGPGLALALGALLLRLRRRSSPRQPNGGRVCMRNVERAAILAVSLCGIPGVAAPQTPSIPVPFDILGYIDAITLDTPGDPASGGAIVANGVTVVVPRNTIVKMPAAALSLNDLFAMAPLPYGPGGNGQSGLARTDSPPPLASYEVHMLGNEVGGVFIAGLVAISQELANLSLVPITCIDYARGDIWVAGTAGACGTGSRVRLADPAGQHGRVSSHDPRFTSDPENPNIRSVTGYPMCLPRTAPPSPGGPETDPLCPQSNRPKAFGGEFQTRWVMGLVGGTDAAKEAPFEVGDQVTISGTLAQDDLGTYVEAWTVVANLGIDTRAGVDPAYVVVDELIFGTGGAPVAHPSGAGVIAQDAVLSMAIIGFTTDPSRLLDAYAVDVDPTTGNESERLIASMNPAGQIVLNQFATEALTSVYLPLSREVRVRIRNTTTANGFTGGTYRAPVDEYIFPVNLNAGDPLVPRNFQDLPFLACGAGLYTPSGGGPDVLFGRLDPFPYSPDPSCVVAPPQGPIASAGADVAAESGGVVALDAGQSADPMGGTLTYNWTQVSGTPVLLSNASRANPTFDAPTLAAGAPAETLVFQVFVTNAIGNATDTVAVTVTPPGSPQSPGNPGPGTSSGASSGGGCGTAPGAATPGALLLALAALLLRRRAGGAPERPC